MKEPYEPILSPEDRAALRAQRAAKRQKRQRARRRRQLLLALPVLVLLAGVAGLLALRGGNTAEEPPSPPPPTQETLAPLVEQALPYSAAATSNTVRLSETFSSTHAVLIDLDSGAILAEKDAHAAIPPASMTKILTLLTAVAQAPNLEDMVPFTREMADYCFTNDCSVVGLEVGETVSVRELLYGTILPSGADAALALATYIAGSQEAFVALMNQQAAALGLSDGAHFTNCVGVYDAENLCSVYDMALILKAAMESPLCEEVLSAHTYSSAPTPQHPEGQILSNWFLRRIEDKDTGTVEVLGAKTGYVNQSGSCAASFAQNAQGQTYLCVTAGAFSAWRCIYDHVELYKTHCK